MQQKYRNWAETRRKYRNWAELKIASARKQQPTRVILRDGTCFESIEPFIWVVDEIYFQRAYTPAPLKIEVTDVVVDIGAHIGVFTVFAASKTCNTVYAFEPSPDNFESLKRNTSANGLNNVIPYRFAVSDRNGLAAFLLSSVTSTRHRLSECSILDTIEKNQTSLEHLQFNNSKLGELEDSFEVPTTTLPDIMDSNSIEQIDFLKMDCEGSEGLILTSTPESYLKRVRKIAMEFHDNHSKINHDEIQKLLERAGFTTNLEWNGESPIGYLFGWRDCLA